MTYLIHRPGEEGLTAEFLTKITEAKAVASNKFHIGVLEAGDFVVFVFRDMPKVFGKHCGFDATAFSHLIENLIVTQVTNPILFFYGWNSEAGMKNDLRFFRLFRRLKTVNPEVHLTYMGASDEIILTLNRKS